MAALGFDATAGRHISNAATANRKFAMLIMAIRYRRSWRQIRQDHGSHLAALNGKADTHERQSIDVASPQAVGWHHIGNHVCIGIGVAHFRDVRLLGTGLSVALTPRSTSLSATSCIGRCGNPMKYEPREPLSSPLIWS